MHPHRSPEQVRSGPHSPAGAAGISGDRERREFPLYNLHKAVNPRI